MAKGKLSFADTPLVNNAHFFELLRAEEALLVSNFELYHDLFDSISESAAYRKTLTRMNKESQSQIYDLMLSGEFIGCGGFYRINKFQRDSQIMFVVSERHYGHIKTLIERLLYDARTLEALQSIVTLTIKIPTHCAHLQSLMLTLMELGFVKQSNEVMLPTGTEAVVLVHDLLERVAADSLQGSVESKPSRGSSAKKGDKSFSRLKTETAPSAWSSSSQSHGPPTLEDYKTISCVYWPQGICMYGNNCRYRHDTLASESKVSGDTSSGAAREEAQLPFYSAVYPPQPTYPGYPGYSVSAGMYQAFAAAGAAPPRARGSPAFVPYNAYAADPAAPSVHPTYVLPPQYAAAAQAGYVLYPPYGSVTYPGAGAVGPTAGPPGFYAVPMARQMSLQEEQFLDLINNAIPSWLSKLKFVRVAETGHTSVESISKDTVDALLSYRAASTLGLSSLAAVATVLQVRPIPSMLLESSLLRPNLDLLAEYRSSRNQARPSLSSSGSCPTSPEYRGRQKQQQQRGEFAERDYPVPPFSSPTNEQTSGRGAGRETVNEMEAAHSRNFKKRPN